MKITPETTNEGAPGMFAFRLDFSFGDFPPGMAAAANLVVAGPPQVLPLVPMPQMQPGDIIMDVKMNLSEPFQNTANAANNSTTVSFGDVASATRFLSAVQVNANGTPVLVSPATPITQFIYVTGVAPVYLQLTINSMAAMSLSTLNRGKAVIWVKLFRASAKVKNLNLRSPVYI